MKVIASAPPASPQWEGLAAEIQTQGIEFSPVKGEAQLEEAVYRLGNPPIVVYNPAGSDHASRVLEWAQAKNVWLPVAVLAEEPDFSHYQECMHYGASAYYDASAEPARLANIIRQAASVAVV